MTDWDSRAVANHSALSTSRRRVAFKRLLCPLSQGEPGWMCINIMPIRFSQSYNLAAENSRPLSDHMLGRLAALEEKRLKGLQDLVCP